MMKDLDCSLLDSAHSQLILVDHQQRLLPAIAGGERVLARAMRLAELAHALQLPVTGTEQSPDKLGPMPAPLRAACAQVLAKSHFDACEAGLLEALRSSVAAGRWQKIGEALGYSGKPVFYELTLNPFGWDSSEAAHTIYRMSQTASFIPGFAASARSFADLAGGIIASYTQAIGAPGLMATEQQQVPPPDVFALYLDKLQASDDYREPPRNVRWNQLHRDDITGGYPGALYNASFAVKREEIAAIMPLLCEAVAGLTTTFLFTLRFVSNASGTLAFTRFPESCVIEIDEVLEAMMAPGLAAATPLKANISVKMTPTTVWIIKTIVKLRCPALPGIFLFRQRTNRCRAPLR